MTIIYTLLVSFVLAGLLGFLLGFFKKIFFVKTDPKIEQIRAVLPGANCGACGYPGCDGCAAAIAQGKAPVTACSGCSVEAVKAIGGIMGVSAVIKPKIAVLACQGSKEHTAQQGMYVGVESCRAAKIVGGLKFCDWGCIGFGDCTKVCKFDAIHIAENGLPIIDSGKCTGCGMCVAECPQKILSRIDRQLKGAFAMCSNRNPNKAQILKQCKTGCIKCGKCERTCPEKAIALVNGTPVVDYNKCTSCGECVKGCPTKVLVLLDGSF